MSWLDKVVTLAVQSAGSLIGTRPTVNFSGSGVTVTDDGANNRVNVAIAGASVSDATTTTKGIVQLAGDIAGTATSVQVAKVNGVSVSGTPSNGQILTASGSSAASWAAPAAPSDATTLAKGIVQLAGDIAGTATSVTVAKVNGVSVSGTPSSGQVLTASGSTAASWGDLPIKTVGFASAADGTVINSTSWADLPTTVAVTMTTGTSALVAISAQAVKQNSGSNPYLQIEIGVRVSGATTIAAPAMGLSAIMLFSFQYDRDSGGISALITGLTAGSNTFTVQSICNAGAQNKDYSLSPVTLTVMAL